MSTGASRLNLIAGDPQRVLTIGLCILLYAFFAFQFPVFASLRSVFSILEGLSVVGLVTLGLTVTIVAGEIDLSVGSLAALTGVIVVKLMVPLGAAPAIAAGLCLALAIGVAQ